MAASEAIDVVLRCSDSLDEHRTRSFTLRPGTSVPIGRASKNAAKPELMVEPGNAYIDSPTISREHAVLTATSPPAAHVYITDKGSMHGTMVNGTKLDPQKPHRLNNGDVLQFGANVTREQLFYTARQFTFESSLPAYPHGFTVPESSDEEDVDVDEERSCPPTYGTQTNPLTIDDADEVQVSEHQGLIEHHEAHIEVEIQNDNEFDDDELDAHLQDTTIPLDAGHDPQGSSSSGLEDRTFFPDVVHEFAAHSPCGFVEDVSSEGDATSSYSFDDGQVSDIASCLSVVGSDESQSDGDMDLEEPDDDEEDEEEEDDEEEEGLKAFPTHRELLEQRNKKRFMMAAQIIAEPQDGSVTYGGLVDRPVSPEMRDDLASVPSTLDDAVRTDASEQGLTAPPESFKSQAGAEPEAPKLSEMLFASNGSFGNSFNRTCFDGLEALPPRPAAPRPMQWTMLDYASPFSPPTNTPSFPVGYSDFACHYPGPVEPLLPNSYSAHQPFLTGLENAWEPSKSSTTVPVSGVQTPPPANASEVPSPPIRRTEVSIREIVEDVEENTQRPPTPTSVTGGKKRKAEALDESSDGHDEPTPQPQQQPASGVVTPVVTLTEGANASHVTVDQRPKKRLRSRIGSAAKTAAAWMLPGVAGAAVSVAFLTSMPNDFFMA